MVQISALKIGEFNERTHGKITALTDNSWQIRGVTLMFLVSTSQLNCPTNTVASFSFLQLISFIVYPTKMKSRFQSSKIDHTLP